MGKGFDPVLRGRRRQKGRAACLAHGIPLMSISRASLISTVLFGITLLPQGCRKNTPQSQAGFVRTVSNTSEVASVTKRPDRVPDFSWKDSAGATVSYEAIRGKVTLINFWATWCGPCKKELPALVELNKEYGARGLKIIGVSADRGANIIDDVRAFVRDNGIPYQVVVSNDELEEAFGNIRALPTSFIVNAEGKIVETFVGARDKQCFVQAITTRLK